MMPRTEAFLFSFLVLLTSAGCATTPSPFPGNVALRSDGTPVAEECPAKALEVMRYLRMGVGDSAWISLDANQMSTRPITLYEGPIESILEEELGTLSSPARLYGRVWTDGPQVVIRYYEAHPLEGDKVPICAVARLGKGQLRKRPESKPGTAILESPSAAVFIVDAFR
ncbi:hypothetical protein [Archangium lansingense]|uniref:Serine/threonine protein kinase n=1 Tax=Archangium lansingense TaxID=2995310 RepID=A0ABT4ANK2_9BACT|nr:hypothetical protein [Archangium lansinium]MCY1083270.1 hypothetical protein [Archangium lansinium]